MKGTAEEMKGVAANRRRRNLNDKSKSMREKPIKAVKPAIKRGPMVEIDDEITVDLRSIKNLQALNEVLNDNE